MTAQDLFRYLVIGNAVLLVGQAVRVIAVYSSVYVVSRGTSRRLPLHVWTIAVSYLVFVFATTLMLMLQPERVDLGVVLLYGLAGFMGQFALYNVLGYERARKAAAAEAFQGKPYV